MHAIDAPWRINEQNADILLETSNARLKDHKGRTASDIARECEHAALAAKIAAIALAQEESEQIARGSLIGPDKAPKRARSPKVPGSSAGISMTKPPEASTRSQGLPVASA